MIAYFLGGCAIYGIVLFVLGMLRPKSALHTKKLIDCGRREKITIGVVLVILILLCTLPMGLAPGWNGEDPARRISMSCLRRQSEWTYQY